IVAVARLERRLGRAIEFNLGHGFPPEVRLFRRRGPQHRPKAAICQHLSDRAPRNRPMLVRREGGSKMSKSILAVAAMAQLPPGVFVGEHDYHLAPAGPYGLDPAHTAVVAKVSHIGYGLS